MGAVQLFYSVKNIFHLLDDMVPTYHKENLQKLPQLPVKHPNNCMYIAIHLLTLDHQFRLHLTSTLCNDMATFVDLVLGFKRLSRWQVGSAKTWMTKKIILQQAKQ